MRRYFLHSNGNAKNHGCEAIIRSTCQILNLGCSNADYVSFEAHIDQEYGLGSIINIIPCKRNIPKYGSVDYYLSMGIQRLISSDYYSKRVVGNTILKVKGHEIALALGGDNYSNANSYKILAYLNNSLRKRGVKSILWGASIEPSLLKLSGVIKDLGSYSMIFARESISFNSLKEAGVSRNLYLHPDPAFSLMAVELPLPNGFIENETIGLNLSPLVQSLDKGENIAFKNYVSLVEYLISNTDYQIALIPHVVWDHNNDLEPLRLIYEKFIHTGRVVLIGDHNCMELKGFIARCKMFIGARTHATIAAYSSKVPTLVVGYSVKAKGIAMDIFGTYENYVVPVKSLVNENDLTNAFIWMQTHEQNIRDHLIEFIPEYTKKAWEAGTIINELYHEEN